MGQHSPFSEFLSCNAELSAKEYSCNLWNFPIGERSIEEPLRKAFLSHLSKQSGDAELLVSQLIRTPLLQTAHHLTPTNGPVFHCIDFLCLAGKPAGEPYFVATASGVAFSNTAWSGALSYSTSSLSDILKEGSPSFRTALKAQRERSEQGTGEKRISLIPSSRRDALLYGSLIPESLFRIFEDFAFAEQFDLKPPNQFSDYPSWAIEFCRNIQRTLWQEPKIFYLDLNEIINDYLIRILEFADHPVSRFIFQPDASATEDSIIFLARKPGKKSEKIRPISQKEIHASETAQSLIDRLQKKELCSATFLTFLIVFYLNGFRCAGSFLQFEYLKEYEKIFSKLFPGISPEIPSEERNLFTSGKMPSRELYPLDAWLKGEFPQKERLQNLKMREFWKIFQLEDYA